MEIESAEPRFNNMSEASKVMISRVIGFIGMFFPIVANFIPPSPTRDLCFLVGGILMFISAAVERELFFSGLQLIVTIGAAMALTPFNLTQRAIVPIIATLVFLIYFATSGRLKDRLTLFGSCGVAILALGYAVSNPIIYLLGGLILGIYATMSFRRGVAIAILWAVVNYIFVGAVVYNIYRFS